MNEELQNLIETLKSSIESASGELSECDDRLRSCAGEVDELKIKAADANEWIERAGNALDSASGELSDVDDQVVELTTYIEDMPEGSSVMDDNLYRSLREAVSHLNNVMHTISERKAGDNG